MSKVRIYEYAKQTNMSSKEIITILNRMNIEVNNHMSIMEPQMIEAVEKFMTDVKSRAASAQEKRLEEAANKAQVQQASQATKAAATSDAAPVKPMQKESSSRPQSQVAGSENAGARNRNQGASGPSSASPSRNHSQQGSGQQHQGSGQQRQGSGQQRQGSGQQRHGSGQQRQGGGQQRQGGGQQRPASGQQRPASGQQRQGSQQNRPPRSTAQPGQSTAVIEPDKYQDLENDRNSVPRDQKIPTGRRKQTSPGPGTGSSFQGRNQQNRSGGNRGNDFNRFGGGRGRNQAQHRAPSPPRQADLPKRIEIDGPLTVAEFAKALRRESSEVIKKLLFLGVMATINQEIDVEAITLVAQDMGVEVVVKEPVDQEALDMLFEEEDSAQLIERPPVVTIMGHVDHGKTTLLDAIRQTNVTASEAGGITQHIGAYQVEIGGRKITFLDTPGHAAFTSMRARGAQVTDITILVVAADDGVMPQTIEAINHAKAAGVPIIVAVNKMDKAGANPDRVKQELTEYGLVAEDWGGDTIFSYVSALQKQGLEELLEMILLVADVAELKASPTARSRGSVVEAELDKGRGPVATVLVQNGTLRVGDIVVAGTSFGRVRAMVNHHGRRVKEAPPSYPVEIVGLNDVPSAGDLFVVYDDERKARMLTERRVTKQRAETLGTNSRVTLDDLYKQIQEGEVKDLNVIIKGDVHGSVEALAGSLEKIDVQGVRVKIIHRGVGAITESDILLATASNGIVMGFNVRPEVNAARMAESEKVDVRLYRVIYNAIEEIEAAMKGMLDPEYKEVVQGRAEVRQTFKVSKVGTIAGCYVVEGKLTRQSEVRVIREGIVIFEGKFDTLKRFKDDVREVQTGYECGATFERFNDVKEGDIIEAFVMEQIKA